MEEIKFIVEEAEEGGYIASAVGYSIFTQGETMEELMLMIEDAIKCHFDVDELPKSFSVIS
jgi:predicted RNase H-like HicB family nuclease